MLGRRYAIQMSETVEQGLFEPVQWLLARACADIVDDVGGAGPCRLVRHNCDMWQVTRQAHREEVTGLKPVYIIWHLKLAALPREPCFKVWYAAMVDVSIWPG